jgi:hypothetical protein
MTERRGPALPRRAPREWISRSRARHGTPQRGAAHPRVSLLLSVADPLTGAISASRPVAATQTCSSRCSGAPPIARIRPVAATLETTAADVLVAGPVDSPCYPPEAVVADWSRRGVARRANSAGIALQLSPRLSSSPAAPWSMRCGAGGWSTGGASSEDEASSPTPSSGVRLIGSAVGAVQRVLRRGPPCCQSCHRRTSTSCASHRAHPSCTEPSPRSIETSACGSRTASARDRASSSVWRATARCWATSPSPVIWSELLEVERLLGASLHVDPLVVAEGVRPVGSTSITGAAPAYV